MQYKFKINEKISYKGEACTIFKRVKSINKKYNYYKVKDKDNRIVSDQINSFIY